LLALLAPLGLHGDSALAALDLCKLALVQDDGALCLGKRVARCRLGCAVEVQRV
jgi:hypothetical protein